jgi:hypothetical protein
MPVEFALLILFANICDSRKLAECVELACANTSDKKMLEETVELACANTKSRKDLAWIVRL